MEISSERSVEVIFEGIVQGVYKVFPTKDTTLEAFSHIYKRAYCYFKSEFDKYKVGKQISTVAVPEFRQDMPCIIDAFQNRLPDIIIPNTLK